MRDVRSAQAVGEGRPGAAVDALRRRSARTKATQHIYRARKARPAAARSAAADVAATEVRADSIHRTALIAAALALPGILPGAAHAQAAPDEGVVALRYYDYRDWQPGADRMSVRSPSLYALVPLVRYADGRRLARSRRDVGRVAALSQHAVGRVRPRRHRLSHRGRCEAHEVSRRSRTRRRPRRIRTSATTCPAPPPSNGARGATIAIARTRSASARRSDRIDSVERCRRGRAAGDVRIPARHHAGAARGCDRRVERHVVGRPRLLLRSVQAARRAAGPPADLRVAHALQPVRCRGRRDAARSLIVTCTIRSATGRTWWRRRGCSRCLQASR